MLKLTGIKKDWSETFKELSAYDGRVVGLDVIRFIAIFYVFWGHGALLVPNELKNLYHWIMVAPFEGVSVFFVLSGYLIGGILLRTLFDSELTARSLLNFYKRRWYRTIPNYMVVLLCLIVLEFSDWSGDWRFFLFAQNLWNDHPPFFHVAWSLAVEEWFYLTFPLLMFVLYIVSGRRNGAMWFSVGVFMTVPLLLRVALVNDMITSGPEEVRKVVAYRLDSMMYGIIGAAIARFHKNLWQQNRYLLFSLSVTVLAIMKGIEFFPEIHRHPLYQNGLLFNLESLSVLLLLPLASTVRSLPIGWLNAPVVFISKISYSVYLTHASVVLWFVLDRMQQAGTFSFLRFELERLLLYVLYVFLTLILSLVLYRYVEKPVMEFRDTTTSKY